MHKLPTPTGSNEECLLDLNLCKRTRLAYHGVCSFWSIQGKYNFLFNASVNGIQKHRRQRANVTWGQHMYLLQLMKNKEEEPSIPIGRFGCKNLINIYEVYCTAETMPRERQPKISYSNILMLSWMLLMDRTWLSHTPVICWRREGLLTSYL